MQGLEQRRVGGEHPAVRPHELVGRAGPEVGAQRGQVDRGVGGGVHPVDPVQGAHLVGQVGDPADRGAGADQVRGAGRGDQPGALGEHGGHGIRRQLAGGGVEVDPAHGGADRLGDLHPGPDVRVVVEAGDDHLVAGPPVLGQRAGEVVGERGGAAAEHDAARVGPEQVGQGGAAVGDDLLGPPLGRR